MAAGEGDYEISCPIISLSDLHKQKGTSRDSCLILKKICLSVRL